MAQTQFFKREEKNLDTYKLDFKKALKKVEVVNLFDTQVVDFLYEWIELQKNYIPREDVDGFLPHMKKIFQDKEFYDFAQEQLNQVRRKESLIEYSFDLISELHESAGKFSAHVKKQEHEDALNKSKKESSAEDEKEMKKILKSLE